MEGGFGSARISLWERIISLWRGDINSNVNSNIDSNIDTNINQIPPQLVGEVIESSLDAIETRAMWAKYGL